MSQFANVNIFMAISLRHATNSVLWRGYLAWGSSHLTLSIQKVDAESNLTEASTWPRGIHLFWTPNLGEYGLPSGGTCLLARYRTEHQII